MATGYTYPVKEGKVTTLREFALQCARAFGALIEMRNDPMNASIPDAFKPSDYHAKEIPKQEAEIARLERLTPAQIENEADLAYKKLQSAHEACLKELAQDDERFNAMIKQVKAWEPPTSEHVGLKKFMLEQLTTSLSGDYRPTPPKRLMPGDWHAEALKTARESMAYHLKEQAEDIERALGRTEWVRALRKSLPTDAPR